MPRHDTILRLRHMLDHAKEAERPPTPDRYSGLQFLAALGEAIHERKAAPATDWLGNNKRVEVGTIGLERPFRHYEECPLGFVRRVQIESNRIHAIALSRSRRPVRKDVTQVGVAAGTDHFGPKASGAPIFPSGHIRLRDRLREARPAGAGFIFRR